MNRYVLLAGEQIDDRADVLDRISRVTGLALSFSSSRVAALAHPSCGLVRIGAAGCILGRLFHRHGPAEPVACLTAAEAERLAGGGRSLLTNYWGAYVAAVRDSEGVRVLRDPSGDFPCYFVRDGGLAIFASDAELLVQCGFARASVDCEEIGRQLFRAFVPVPTTALGGINELLAGFALHVGAGDAAQQQCWDPWDHVAARDEDRDVAAGRLERTIRHSVQAIAPHRGRLLLSVSGGLDSSIVGSCLARAGTDAVCLTMFTGDPAGDERPFARALCDQAGLRLIERQYRLDDVDLDQAMAPNLPRPRDRIHALAFERVHYAVAAEIGAQAFMTGNGGDHVFGYSQSAAPVADLYLSEGLTAATLGTLRDVCRQTGCNVADAVAQAWRLAHGPPSRPVRPNPLFLHAEFAAELGPRDRHHPWLDAPAGALPGKAAHVATILRVQPNLEPSLGDLYPVLNPLVSQPVVEACLAIPSWEWRAGGRDRAMVRNAFADVLPGTILGRRVKGTPGRFAAQVLDHFRKPIRDRLLAGRLAQSRIIDGAALDRILDGERPVPDLERVRILELVSAEAWIGHWTARAEAPEPVQPDIRSDVHVRFPSSADPIP